MSLTSIIVITLFCSFFIGSIFNPLMGILGYLSIYLIFNYYSWYCQPFLQFASRPSFIAMLFLVLGCLIHYRKLNWHFTRKEIAIYLFLGTAWIVTHFFGVLIDHQTLKFLYKITKVFVFIFLFIRIVNTWEQYNYVIWMLICAAVFLAYQGHVVAGSMSSGRLESVGGIDFAEANVFCAFLALGVILLGYKLLNARLWKKIFYVIGLAIMVDAIILTRSRAVFLGLFFATPFVVFSIPQKYKKQLFVYIGLAIVMFFFLVDISFTDRMRTIDDEVLQGSNSSHLFGPSEKVGRIRFWKSSIDIFKDHPMGIGVSNFANIVPFYDPRNIGMDPHNTYVKCYTEIGIIGIILFLYIILKSFSELRQIRKMIIGNQYEEQITLASIALTAVFITYLFGVMVTHSILYSEMIWILFALITCLRNVVSKLCFEKS